MTSGTVVTDHLECALDDPVLRRFESHLAGRRRDELVGLSRELHAR